MDNYFVIKRLGKLFRLNNLEKEQQAKAFQASIPATLKNVFDLLPVNAFRDKVVSIIVTAGTPKYYMMVEQQLKPILSKA